MDNQKEEVKKEQGNCKKSKCCKKDDKLAEVVSIEAAQNTEIDQDKKADN